MVNLSAITQSKYYYSLLRVAIAGLSLTSFVACTGPSDTAQTSKDSSDDVAAAVSSPLTDKVALTGAGASFPSPLYQNWFIQLNKDIPELQVNYQSVGSGAGIEQFTAKTVNFGASDVAMKDEEIEAVADGAILLPMTAGSIVLAYNLPDVKSGLKLPREVYVDILLGKITKWNDDKIADANPGITLPDTAITVVHRSDGSGTTGVFTKHLSAISSEWEETIGEGKSVEWPTSGNFVGAKGSEGMTAQLQQTEGAIGYVEFGFARNNKLAIAALENKAGKFIEPTPESASATLDAIELPDNLRAFITDPEGDGSYPVVTYTWMLAYEKYEDPQQAIAMELMIQNGLTKGQIVAEELGYVPLPQSVRERVAAAADVISPDYKITLN
ncbi:MAG: phosphate ABC transporter substrate-binding protein PstS [Leptolyngbya sp. SIO3F4]|nr:phosphate ABC transporter substrate-binding protein PstS [Leptolyngbya sp. SIO3F4]